METDATEEEPRRLADFLRTHRETILSDWLTAVRSLAPARRLDRPMLIDHLPQYLDDLADFLDEVRAGHTAAEPVKAPVMHALERLEVGYNLSEVVEEYALLRQCIVELVHREGAPAMRSAVGAPPFGNRPSHRHKHGPLSRGERADAARTRPHLLRRAHPPPAGEDAPGVAQGATRDLCSRRRGSAAVARGRRAPRPRRGGDRTGEHDRRNGFVGTLPRRPSGRDAGPCFLYRRRQRPAGDAGIHPAIGTARLLRRTDDVRRRARRSGHNWVAERGRILRGGPPPFPYHVGPRCRAHRPGARRGGGGAA